MLLSENCSCWAEPGPAVLWSFTEELISSEYCPEARWSAQSKAQLVDHHHLNVQRVFSNYFTSFFYLICLPQPLHTQQRPWQQNLRSGWAEMALNFLGFRSQAFLPLCGNTEAAVNRFNVNGLQATSLENVHFENFWDLSFGNLLSGYLAVWRYFCSHSERILLEVLSFLTSCTK